MKHSPKINYNCTTASMAEQLGIKLCQALEMMKYARDKYTLSEAEIIELLPKKKVYKGNLVTQTDYFNQGEICGGNKIVDSCIKALRGKVKRGLSIEEMESLLKDFPVPKGENTSVDLWHQMYGLIWGKKISSEYMWFRSLAQELYKAQGQAQENKSIFNCPSYGRLWDSSKCSVCECGEDKTCPARIKRDNKVNQGLLEALKKCIETLTNKAIGTVDYMDGADIYEDFRNTANYAKQAIKDVEEEK